MKTKKLHSKLVFNKQTIANLDITDLREIYGAAEMQEPGEENTRDLFESVCRLNCSGFLGCTHINTCTMIPACTQVPSYCTQPDVCCG